MSSVCLCQIFQLQGQDLVVRHFVPPSCSSREAVLALNSANKYHWRVMEHEGHSEIMSGHQRTADMFTYNREGDSKEVFPMGYRGHTHLENGWVDLACGPSISLVVNYVSRAHHPSPALPNTMQVDIDAPTVLLRAFGFLMTDLLALKVSTSGHCERVSRDITSQQENYPGEYIDFSTYHSTSFSDQYAPLAPRSPLGEAPPAAPPPEVPDEPQERFVDVVVDFTLRNVTAEFPTVSVCCVHYQVYCTFKCVFAVPQPGKTFGCHSTISLHRQASCPCGVYLQ